MAMGVPAANLSDEDLRRELLSLKSSEDDILGSGTDAQREHHRTRTAELENEFVARFSDSPAAQSAAAPDGTPGTGAPDPGSFPGAPASPRRQHEESKRVAVPQRGACREGRASLMRVAVLGTGTMGAGMARALLRDGHEVSAWNRSADRAAPLKADGATISSAAAEAVRDADVVLTMLFDADAVLEVMSESSVQLAPNAVWLQSSTVGLEGIGRIAELASVRSWSLLDTPVLGTKQPAEAGELVVLASGDPALRQRVTPVIEAIGSKTVWAGDLIGQASALKLVGNTWVTAITAALGLSIALAESLHLDPTLFLDAIADGPSDTPYAHLKGAAVLAADFPPSFALDGALKDLRLIGEAAAGAGLRPELLTALTDTYQSASDGGLGAQDIAAVAQALRPGRQAPTD